MCGRGRPHDSRPGGRRYIPATFLPLQIQAVTALLVVGDEEAEVAEVLAGGSGDDGVAEGGEHGAGVEVGERRLEVETEGVGAGDGGGVGYGSGCVGVAVDAVGAGAEDGEALAGVLL